jgi:tRNA (cmo5U34)-methyltransferase
MTAKSSVEDIRRRFDNDVERFSNLETGQSATIDAPLTLDLIAGAAAGTTPYATHMLDVGCGAGNYALKLLQRLPALSIDLVDLSRPMLDRAVQRVAAVAQGPVRDFQADIRDLVLEDGRYDIITAAATLHHLRGDEEWRQVFTKLHRSLKPGGWLWISDLILHSDPGVQALMWARYGEHLAALKDEAYRDHVFSYIEVEDTPRPLLYQIDLMRSVGFSEVDILHKNSSFAAFGGRK